MSSLTLQEKLDLLPHDRHVRLFKLKDSPDWYATWSVHAKPVTMHLGVDEHGLIDELVKQWSVSKPAHLQKPVCSQHGQVKLWCTECILGVKERMKRSA
jgi:hypothetical protein